MIFRVSHQICLSPTMQQERYFRQACGTARFAWNWGLEQWQKQYANGEKPNEHDLKKSFNAIKATEFPWTADVTKYAAQQPFLFLGKAFRSFFRRGSQYPRFKKKGIHDSFYIGNDHIQYEGKQLRIPKLGWVRLRERLRYTGRIVSVTISRVANKWFASIQVETDQLFHCCDSQASVGVDLGLLHLATLSDGTVIDGPKPLKRYLKQLKRYQRRLSRKIKGSQNRAKARMKVAKLHYKISCIRQDALHKLTTFLVKNYKRIVIEDLHVKGMMANHCLARAIADVGLYEFRRQLTYKAKWYGNQLEVADRWFASSKTCSNCHVKKTELRLSDRKFQCDACGHAQDRDLNAAVNLLNTVSSTELQACGEDSPGLTSLA